MLDDSTIVHMAGYYDTYESRTRRRHTGRSVLGYWIPLAVTVTAATVGLAAWIWSERPDDNDDETDNDDFKERKERREEERDEYGEEIGRHDKVEPRPPPGYGAEASGDPSFPTRDGSREVQDVSTGMMARMSGAIRRTPSPQQILDEASRRVAAGVAAAGAVVGGALSSIREESRDDYGDHSRWSEEADMRVAQRDVPRDQADPSVASATSQPHSNVREPEARMKDDIVKSTAPSKPQPKRKTVAIVVSAETSGDLHKADVDDHHEDAVGELPGLVDCRHLTDTSIVHLVTFTSAYRS